MFAEFMRQLTAQLDWGSAVVFGGVVLAVVCLLVLQKVRERELRKKLAALESKLNERMDEQTDAAVEAALAADGRARDALREAQGMQERVDDVERRIPTLQEKLEHFRLTLASIFQNELGAVLSSFDSSVSAVLEHMKADLHMGVARIETIEEMVQSRQKAGRALLCSGEAPALADATDVCVEQDEPAEEMPAPVADEAPADAEADVLADIEGLELDDASDERSEAA